MNNTIKTLSMLTSVLLTTSPVMASDGGFKTNLKTADGKPVGSLDEKYFLPQKHDQKPIKTAISDSPKDWPKDWKWERNIDSNKPLFNQLDANTDGAISKEEFRITVIHDKEDMVFAALDKNKSENISRSELDKFSQD